MMKFLLILGCVALAMAQRPSFAGTSAKGYPEVASRFRETESTSEVPSNNSSVVVNRIGVANETSTTTTTTTTQKLPIDARGDVELVNRLNQWPAENRPFWLINADLIEKHRDPEGTQKKQRM